MEQSKLSAPIKKIFMGVLIYVIAGLVYSIINPYIEIAETAANASSIAGALTGIDAGISGAGAIPLTLKYLALAAMICGYVFTFMGLNGFKAVSAEAEAKAVGQVRISYILLVVAALVDMIPLMGWASAVLTIISVIFLVMGYNKLKNAEVYNKDMKGGFSILFLAAIIILVGEGLDFIPFAGDILWAICTFAGLVITLIGWNKVKRGAVKA